VQGGNGRLNVQMDGGAEVEILETKSLKPANLSKVAGEAPRGGGRGGGSGGSGGGWLPKLPSFAGGPRALQRQLGERMLEGVQNLGIPMLNMLIAQQQPSAEKASLLALGGGGAVIYCLGWRFAAVAAALYYCTAANGAGRRLTATVASSLSSVVGTAIR